VVEQPHQSLERLGGAEHVHVVDERKPSGLLGDRPEQELDALRPVVRRLERDFQDIPPVALGPLGEQRRLAVSGRSDDRGDGGISSGAKPVDEHGATDRVLRGRGHGQAPRKDVRADQWFHSGHPISLRIAAPGAKGAHRSGDVGTPPPGRGPPPRGLLMGSTSEHE
jgi:hypothetical protein